VRDRVVTWEQLAVVGISCWTMAKKCLKYDYVENETSVIDASGFALLKTKINYHDNTNF
jgi:hypothetical protein